MKAAPKKTDAKKEVQSPEQPVLTPRLPWQTGPFSRDANFRFFLPYQFLLLCKLTDTTPEAILHDFMHHLACGSPGTMRSAAAKETLIEYFIQAGYGQHHYSPDEIRQIFSEMDAIGMLFPKDASAKMLDLHSRWRDQYQRYWFEKWQNKPLPSEKKTENSFIISAQ